MLKIIRNMRSVRGVSFNTATKTKSWKFMVNNK